MTNRVLVALRSSSSSRSAKAAGSGRFLRMVIVMTSAVAVGMAIDRLSMRDADTIMVLLAGVLLTSTFGDRLTGLISSLLAVMAFNFFFTEPRYTFVVADSSYLITFPVMLVVAFVTSELTTRLQLSAELAQERQRRAEVLYRISEQMISARTTEEIRETAAANLHQIIEEPVSIRLSDTSNPFSGGFDARTAVSIATDDTRFGEIVVEDSQSALSAGQRAMLHAIAAQLAIALDRERLTQAEESARINAERERVRANLLRSVSHDLRTPLAAIAGAASALIEVEEIPESHRRLPQNIFHDSMWLSEIVENILSLTRLNDSELNLRRTNEVLEEIVLETVERMRRRFEERMIEIELPEEIILVEVDAPLFGQMLTNILANALDFSPEDQAVAISVGRVDHETAEIVVRDHGMGMDDTVMEHAFDLFFTQKPGDDSRRGLGVGLTIAKTVVDLHRGAIELARCPDGGTEVRIRVPVGGAHTEVG